MLKLKTRVDRFSVDILEHHVVWLANLVRSTLFICKQPSPCWLL